MPPRKKTRNENAPFFVLLCNDALLDVLRFGTRRQLVKLEQFGLRFYRCINVGIDETPFLRLNLELLAVPELCESEYASFAFVGHGLYPDTNISLVDLATLPRYLRFGIVAIKFDASSLHEISIKCALIQNLLPLFAADKFINSRLQISCKIDHNDATSFSDPSMLLNCLANDVLPIFPSCRAFKFIIRSDKIAETSVLAPVLQFSHINRCSNVCFWFCTEARRPPPTQLPTETISHWLNRSCGGCKGEGKHPAKERCLEIYTKSKWENIHEQCDCLKKRFAEAEFPAQSFTLRIDNCERAFDDQILQNKKTGEELTIVHQMQWHAFKRAGIKQSKELLRRSKTREAANLWLE